MRRDANEFGSSHGPLPSACEAPERTGAAEGGQHVGIGFDSVHVIQNLENGLANGSDGRPFLAVGKPQTIAGLVDLLPFET